MIYIVSPHLGNKWKDIQRGFIEECTKEKHEYIQYDVPKGQKHLRSLGECLQILLSKCTSGDLLIEMDSDAFPFRKEWIHKIQTCLKNGNEFVAVQRLENPYFYKNIAHPCFCAWSADVEVSFSQVAHNPFIEGWKVRQWAKLRRTNRKNLHQQMFAIYGNIAYHHGAGSRDVSGEDFFRKGLKKEEGFFDNPHKFILELA